MTDYSKIIDKIKLSEIRVASFSKEIKYFDEQIKKTDEEREIVKGKDKLLTEELEYKRRVVAEKVWELAGLQREYCTWENMLQEKKDILVNKSEELESVQNRVWDTRRAFLDTTTDFLSKHNFLKCINTKIDVLIRKQEDRKNIMNCIELLENKVNSIEKIYNESKSKFDVLTHLKKERDRLMAYEFSPEVLRLQNSIANCTKELESIEKELSKYCERAVMNPHDLVLLQNNSYNLKETLQVSTQENVVEDGYSSVQDKKQSFKRKTPSFLITRQTPSGTIDHRSKTPFSSSEE